MLTERNRRPSDNSLESLIKAASSNIKALEIDLDSIETEPQVRVNFKNIDELAQSLIQEGQQTPIIVSPADRRGKYLLQKGERRFRAAKQAGMKKIMAVIAKPPKSELDGVAGQLIENLQREDLEPLEIAAALKVFADSGWSQIKIAERISKNQSYVSRHLYLLELPAVVLDVYEQGHVRDVKTLTALGNLHKLNEESCVQVCELARQEGGVSRGHVAAVLRKIRSGDQATDTSPATPQGEPGSDEAVVPADAGHAGLEPKAKEPTPIKFAPREEGATELQGYFDCDEMGGEEDEVEGVILESPDDDEHSYIGRGVQMGTAADTEVQSRYKPPQEAFERVTVLPQQRLSIAVTWFGDRNEAKTGRLMLDAVSPHSSFVWVVDAGGETHLVHAARVAIDSVSVE